MAQLSDDCFAFGGPLMSVEDAAALMAGRITPLAGTETIPLGEADGRVLAEDMHTTVALPPFDNSAVDGYAVRHADLQPGMETRLPLGGRVPAGASGAALATTGVAIRIFTGAPMPPGTDTVFMQEDATPDGDHVILPAGLKRGANRRKAGEDISVGALALPKGRRLRPQELALLSAIGLTDVIVTRRLKVAIFSTGDELTEPGSPLGSAAIYDANRALLAALVRRAGAEVIDLGILRDKPEELAPRLAEAASRNDLVLTSGGVSTGEEDHVKGAVERAGSLVFWRIAIKPGRPVAMGVIAGKPFVGLPGNPVAVFITFVYVVRPLIALLSGTKPATPAALPVRMGFSYRKKTGRREYVRVSLVHDGSGLPVALKHPQDGAGVLTSLTETDGLIELGEDLTEIAVDETVPFFPYASLM
jgi:molybdopterin molybdotransferase